jgi:hypothetical protein
VVLPLSDSVCLCLLVSLSISVSCTGTHRRLFICCCVSVRVSPGRPGGSGCLYSSTSQFAPSPATYQLCDLEPGTSQVLCCRVKADSGFWPSWEFVPVHNSHRMKVWGETGCV